MNFWILSFSLFLTMGCSSIHEVAVVSHGDEVAAVKEAESEKSDVVLSAPPELDLSPIPLKQKEPIPFPLPPAPITPPVAPPSPKTPVGPDIFAQSADDSTIPLTLEDVFFDFDQMVIRLDAIPLLEQNAKVLLKRYADREVLIQGHCDERGTEAYNLILGERRATAVKNYLMNLGVAASQLRVLSLGKSQPFCQERTISCFRQNRRAHFVLK